MTAGSQDIPGKYAPTRALFWLTTGIFLLLIATGIVVNHWFIDRQKSTAMTLNLMGRQRMLSQKMAKDALVLYLQRPVTTEALARLAETRVLFESTFLALQRGGDVIVDGKAVSLPPVVYPEIREHVRASLPLWQRMVDAVAAIRTGDTSAAGVREKVLDISRSSEALLRTIDAAVLAFQARVAEETTIFHYVQAGGLVLLSAIAALLGFWLFHFFIWPLRLLAERVNTVRHMAVGLEHRLNNFLAGILGVLSVLASKEPLSEEARSIILRCQEEARAVQELIEKLPELSDPVVAEYLRGIRMIDLDRSIGRRSPPLAS